jgi:tRNA(fMet)-specific endonuclease VapC
MDKQVLKKVESSEDVFVPSIVIGELCYGAYNSDRIDENITKIERLRVEAKVLYCNYEIAKEFGKIKAE